MKSHHWLGLTLWPAIALGCASSSTQNPPQTAAAVSSAPNAEMGMMKDSCPMQVPGTAVSVDDVEGGVAISFSTSQGNVADLRQRVRSMAEMHNRHQADGMMMGGGPHESGAGAGHEHKTDDAAGHSGGAMMGGMMMPATTATVEDTDQGARIVVRPRDPADLAGLRQHARMNAAKMSQGECPMMPMGSGSDDPTMEVTTRPNEAGGAQSGIEKGYAAFTLTPALRSRAEARLPAPRARPV